MSRVASSFIRKRGRARVARWLVSLRPCALILSPSAKGTGEPRTTPRVLRTRARNIVLVLILSCLFVRPAFSLTPGDLSRVTFQQHVGSQVSPELIFRDETNRSFRLGDHFGKQFTILVLGYYRCPMLCTLINDGLIKALQDLPASIGGDFQVVDVSIDPTETAAAAAAKKSEYLRQYARPRAADGWHFLVGDKHSIAQLADEVGYRYVYDPVIRQYAHPSGLVILTPDGKISRYIFGVNFDSKEVGSALIAAQKRQSSSPVSQFLLLCYHYNPVTGKYSAFTLNGLRIISLIFVLAIGLWIFAMARRSGKTQAEGG
jgi:protein SCO1